MEKISRIAAAALVVSVLLNSHTSFTQNVKKTSIKQKKVTMKVGTTKKIQLKAKKKKAKYTYKSSKKKIVRVSKNGKMTALKAGKAKITVKETLKKKTKKIGTISVTVKLHPIDNTPPGGTSQGSTPTAPASVAPSAAPSDTPAPSETPNGTEKPSPTPVPTPEDPRINNTPAKFTTKRAGVEYGEQVTEQYHSTTTGVTRHAIVILPPHYTEEKQYPVLYLFHGGMGDENDWIQGGIRNMIGNMLADGEAKEMIIVLPNCRCREDDSAANANGFALDHVQSFDNFIHDFKDNLMPYIEETYSVATGRKNTAIGGLSMGGRVSLYIGFSLPELVGYTGAFSPAYGIFPYTNNGLTEEGLFTEKTFTLPDEYKQNTLIMMNTGLQDTMVKDEPDRYHNALAANNVEHIFYKLKGSHDWVVWRNGFYNFARYLFKDKSEGGLV